MGLIAGRVLIVMTLMTILIGIATSQPRFDARADFAKRCDANGGTLGVDGNTCTFHLKAPK